MESERLCDSWYDTATVEGQPHFYDIENLGRPACRIRRGLSHHAGSRFFPVLLIGICRRFPPRSGVSDWNTHSGINQHVVVSGSPSVSQ